VFQVLSTINIFVVVIKAEEKWQNKVQIYMHECLMGYKNKYVNKWETEVENNSLIGNMKAPNLAM